MSSDWTRIRSWHLVHPFRVTRANGRYTYCGRFVGIGPAVVDMPPETERTCELCFRARERQG